MRTCCPWVHSLSKSGKNVIGLVAVIDSVVVGHVIFTLCDVTGECGQSGPAGAACGLRPASRGKVLALCSCAADLSV